MFQTVQKAVAAKETDLGELQTKIRELGRKEIELRNEKVSDMLLTLEPSVNFAVIFSKLVKFKLKI